MICPAPGIVLHKSLSARRAWIEIRPSKCPARGQLVALRKESVDRNTMIITICIAQKRSLSARRAWIEMEELLHELSSSFGSLSARRAWIEIASRRRVSGRALSLSARRAWIEILTRKTFAYVSYVALRKESVDRNLWWGVRKAVGSLSLSARRAWIEIRVS